MADTKKTESPKKGKVLKVDNSVNPNASVEYLVWCDHTTLVDNGDGPASTQLKKGDIVDGKTIPQVWLDQGLSSRFLINAKEAKKLSKEDLAKRGYYTYGK